MDKLIMKLILILSFLVYGCSSFQKVNDTVSGEVLFKGGKYQDFSWKDSMVFQRTSFYRGATMAYDVLLHKLDRKSPFVKWFDDSEKKYLSKCHTLLIGIFYVEATQPTSMAFMRQEITNQSYQEVFLPGLNQYLKNHPTYQQYYLFSHHISAFCSQETMIKEAPIVMSLPGFNKVKLL